MPPEPTTIFGKLFKEVYSTALPDFAIRDGYDYSYDARPDHGIRAGNDNSDGLWRQGFSWAQDHSLDLDDILQPYLINDRRLGAGKYMIPEWAKAMDMYFIGNVTREVRDQSITTLGYRWKSVDVSDHEVVRSRDYAHWFYYEDGVPFPDNDPYRKLYDLVHFENASSFWLKLQACQQAKCYPEVRGLVHTFT